MRRIDLSVPVAVVALVSRYLTNKLIAHGPLPGRQVPTSRDPRPLTAVPYDTVVSSGITPPFGGLSLCPGYVAHVFLTRSPLYYPGKPGVRVRLACLSHAASVRSEPGSNSSVDYRLNPENVSGFSR